MKGRKATPSKIIELTGGRMRTHRPPRDEEPRPPEKRPHCPRHLDKLARKEWRRAVRLLEDVSLLTELDMPTLAGYAQAYSEWAEATNQILRPGEIQKPDESPKKGPVWVDKQGIPHMNPWLRVAREAFERMMKNAVLIGMSPSSRASLKVPKKKAPGKVEKFMGRKSGTAS